MVKRKGSEGILMDEVERKRLIEVRDLLSSVDFKILEMLKTETKELFITEKIIEKESPGVQIIDGHVNFGEHISGSTIEVKFPINWALPKTGKYQWYKMSNEEGKIRKCLNPGCKLFLKYNKEIGTYEHWKIDANSGKAFFVDKYCTETLNLQSEE